MCIAFRGGFNININMKNCLSLPRYSRDNDEDLYAEDNQHCCGDKEEFMAETGLSVQGKLIKSFGPATNGIYYLSSPTFF
jgi:hypothetical protein